MISKIKIQTFKQAVVVWFKSLVWRKHVSEASLLKYDDWDYQHLCELYFKNEWLSLEANNRGLQDLWFEYLTKEERLAVKALIMNFEYVPHHVAESLCERKLRECIKNWGLSATNTLFVAPVKHRWADGSGALAQLMKGVLRRFGSSWLPSHVVTNLNNGLEIIRNQEFERQGRTITKLVIIDDFVGTGSTAVGKLTEAKEQIAASGDHVEVYFFCIAAMKDGLKELRKIKARYQTCLVLNKGTKKAFPILERKRKRNLLVSMERVLADKINWKKLKDHSLGWGESETLYTWDRYNIPNNVFPIFWWSKKVDGSDRKTMFNRNQ